MHKSTREIELAEKNENYIIEQCFIFNNWLVSNLYANATQGAHKSKKRVHCIHFMQKLWVKCIKICIADSKPVELDFKSDLVYQWILPKLNLFLMFSLMMHFRTV